MKLYLFKYLNQVSGNYHSGGGLVIIAKDRKHANQLVKSDPDIEVVWKDLTATYTVEEVEPRYFVFPDAGCC